MGDRKVAHVLDKSALYEVPIIQYLRGYLVAGVGKLS